MDELKNHLKRFRWRLRLYDGWEIFQQGLWLSLLISLGIQLSGRIIPVENLWLWTCIPPATWVIFVACFHLLRSYSIENIARRIDLELGLFERLSTSLALEANHSSFIAELVETQKQDALITTRSIQIVSAYPLKFFRRGWLIAAVVTAVLVALIFIQNPMEAILEQRRAVTQEAIIQSELIEARLEELEQATGLNPEEAEQLKKMLAELAERLRANPGDLDQALADISDVEREIQAGLNPRAALDAANLAAIVKQLQELAEVDSLEGKDLAEAAQQALQALSDNQNDLDDAERMKVASALAQLSAVATVSGNAQLGGALSQLAQAISAKDLQRINRAARDTTTAIDQLQNSLLAQSQRADLLAMLQSSRQAMALRGQAASNGSSAPGNQGQVAGGGGTNAPVLPPGTSTGGINPPQGNKPFSGEDDLAGNGNIPRQSGNFVGDQLYIPGIATGAGEIQVRPGDNQLPGNPNPALVPYEQAYYQYLNAAMQAIGQDYIPTNLLNYVQQYFLNLEPK